MTEAEQFFWDRIASMPALEAEQELLLRKERLALENAMLAEERAKLLEARGVKRNHEAHRIGVAISENCALLGLVTERIKYLRRVNDSIQWRRAVTALYGQDAYEACAEWVAQNDEGADFRREWASPKSETKIARLLERRAA